MEDKKYETTYKEYIEQRIEDVSVLLQEALAKEHPFALNIPVSEREPILSELREPNADYLFYTNWLFRLKKHYNNTWPATQAINLKEKQHSRPNLPDC